MQIQNGDDALRFARHTVDGDTLVFDPALFPAGPANVTFFSLTQFRPRSFPHSVVETRIDEVVDPEQCARAAARYLEWPELKLAHEQEAEGERQARAVRQRERILEAHRRFVEEGGRSYEGVQDSAVAVTGGSKRRTRAACPRCSTPVDDFAGTRCMGCKAVLCSCGACACVRAAAPVAE
jgi:hypothetical protein